MSLLRLWRRYPRQLGYGLLHFFSGAVGQTFFVSLFVAGVTAELGWAEGDFAGYYSAVTLVAAFSLPAVGTLVDRYRIRYVSTAAALVLAVALLVLAFAKTVWLFLPALFLVRLGGQGTLPLIASTTVGRYFDAERGRALSATAIGTSLGEIAIPPLTVWSIATHGYASAWVAAAAYMVVVFVPLTWWLVRRGDAFQTASGVAMRLSAKPAGRAVPAVASGSAGDGTGSAAAGVPLGDVPEAEAVLAKASTLHGTALPVDGVSAGAAPTRSWTRGEVLSDLRFRLVVPALVLSPFVLTGIIFNQGLIAETRGYTAAWMALGISSYGVARATMTLLGGGLIDRYGAARLIQLVAAPMLLGLAVLLLAEAAWSVPAFFVLAGLATGAESVVWPALWAERYGPEHLGSIKSATRLLMVLTTAAAPVLFAWVLGHGLGVLLVALLVYAVVAVVLVWVAAGRGEE